ncbi:endoglucanase, partial [Elysia marginata]
MERPAYILTPERPGSDLVGETSAAMAAGSSRDEDELAWAAAWLYKATGHRRYLSKAVLWLAKAPACWAQSWDDKTCGATILLYQLTKDTSLKSNVEEIFQTWLPGGGIQYTPKGLAYRSRWGALRYT